jgi:CRP/FNR family transcriptional regulator
MTADARRGLNLLRGAGAFPDLPDESLERLAAQGSVRNFAASETIFHEGSEASAFFIILEGHVEVSRSTSGREYVLHHERAGGTLGEVPVFSGTGYLATAKASLATTCLTISASAARRLVARDIHFASWVIERLGARIVELVKRLETATAMSTSQRIARYVLERSARSPGERFRLGMSQESLARELGTVREVVSRSLSRLEEDGIVERTSGGWIVVLDSDALAQRASDV